MGEQWRDGFPEFDKDWRHRHHRLPARMGGVRETFYEAGYNAAENRAAGDAEREADRLWGTIKNAVDDLETGFENWGDLAEVRLIYRCVLADLKAALSASTAPRADAEGQGES